MAAMTLMGLLIALRAACVRLDVDAEGLRVDAPAGTLTPALQQAIRDHQAALQDLPRPFLSEAGDLISPALAAPQYHWQPMAQTLLELDAPLDTWRKYVQQRNKSNG